MWSKFVIFLQYFPFFLFNCNNLTKRTICALRNPSMAPSLEPAKTNAKSPQPRICFFFTIQNHNINFLSVMSRNSSNPRTHSHAGSIQANFCPYETPLCATLTSLFQGLLKGEHIFPGGYIYFLSSTGARKWPV